jgi:hypothetical protein
MRREIKNINLAKLSTVPSLHTMACPIVQKTSPILAMNNFAMLPADVVRMWTFANLLSAKCCHSCAGASIGANNSLTELAFKILWACANLGANAIAAYCWREEGLN